MIRDDSIHVSGETRRALSFLPRTDACPTSDAWADKILSEWFVDHEPQILAHVRQQKIEDDDLRQRKQNAAAARAHEPEIVPPV